jgi:N-acetylneuraminic acid mutarotase
MMATLGGEVILFGGAGGTLGGTELADTWAWNGSTWTQKATAQSPVARDSGVAVSLGGKVVLFGGQDTNAAALADTWTWDGTGWTQLANLSPAPEGRLGAAGAVLQGKLVLFGGKTNLNNGFLDTWIFDGTSWIQGPANGPTLRTYAAMTGPG